MISGFDPSEISQLQEQVDSPPLTSEAKLSRLDSAVRFH